MLEQGTHKRKRLAIEIALPLESSARVPLQVESFASDDDLVSSSSPTQTHPVRPPSILVPLAFLPDSPVDTVDTPPFTPSTPARSAPLVPVRRSGQPSIPPLPAPRSGNYSRSSSQASPAAISGGRSNRGAWFLAVLGLGCVAVMVKTCGNADQSSDSVGGGPSSVVRDTTAVMPGPSTGSAVVLDTAGAPDPEPARPKSSSVRVMTDPRDGKAYGTVRIGHQLWMAENLDHLSDNSWCYDQDASNCSRFGRLYNGSAVSSACPSGWHVPSDGEWKTLERSLGMDTRDAGNTGYRGTDEGRKLKSRTGWGDGSNGTDDYGFQVLPAGAYGKDGAFGDLGRSTCFWSSSERDEKSGWGRCFNQNRGGISRGFLLKAWAFSIRCVED